MLLLTDFLLTLINTFGGQLHAVKLKDGAIQVALAASRVEPLNGASESKTVPVFSHLVRDFDNIEVLVKNALNQACGVGSRSRLLQNLLAKRLAVILNAFDLCEPQIVLLKVTHNLGEVAAAVLPQHALPEALNPSPEV